MTKQVIGITGGIGCGKSVVMDLLKENYGAYVILADSVGHELMKPGGANYNGILEYFGSEVLDSNGEIDRRILGGIVFSCESKLKVLNQITHTNIINEIKSRIEKAMEEDSYNMVCLESAILLTTPLIDLCDQSWYIYANEEIRIKRLMDGRGYTEEYCRRVMREQKKEEFYRERTDLIIDNSGSIEDTRMQLKEILK